MKINMKGMLLHVKGVLQIAEQVRDGSIAPEDAVFQLDRATGLQNYSGAIQGLLEHIEQLTGDPTRLQEFAQLYCLVPEDGEQP